MNDAEATAATSNGRALQSHLKLAAVSRRLDISPDVKSGNTVLALYGPKPCYRPRVNWPGWWNWALEMTPHVEKRMETRGFTELDLRSMLEQAVAWRPDHVAGRFIIDTRLRGRKWEIVVEPDEMDHLVVVVTAYRVES